MDAVCIGEILIDMFSGGSGASLEDVKVFLPKPGGAPANLACGISKLGHTVSFIGKVGNDAFGRLLTGTLRKAGVRVSNLVVDGRTHTTLAFIARRRDGSVDFEFYRNPGADMMLREGEVSKELVTRARILCFGSVSLSLEPARSAVLKAAGWARRAGRAVFFDVNYREAIWNDPARARREILKALALADIVKVNREELVFVTGADDFEKGSRQILSQGPHTVLMTQGPGTVSYQNRSVCGCLEPFKVKAVDMVGCGDAFASGIVAMYVERIKGGVDTAMLSADEMREIVRFANACGAITATRLGVIPALPSGRQVLRFLRERKGRLPRKPRI